MLSLILIKSDKEQTKISKEPPLSGPHVVIYIDVKIKNVLAMELTTGIIYNRSYRNIIKYLPNTTLLSTSMYQDWNSVHQSNILPRELNRASIALAGNEDQYKNILSNLIHLYDVLINILPPIEETIKQIVIDDTDLEYEEPITTNENLENEVYSDSEEETNQNMNNREIDEMDESELTVTLALAQEQEEKQKTKEEVDPDLIEGPRTRSKRKTQLIPSLTTQKKATPDKKEDPQDKHPVRTPHRRSPRRQYFTSNGEPTNKAPTN